MGDTDLADMVATDVPASLGAPVAVAEPGPGDMADSAVSDSSDTSGSGSGAGGSGGSSNGPGSVSISW